MIASFDGFVDFRRRFFRSTYRLVMTRVLGFRDVNAQTRALLGEILAILIIVHYRYFEEKEEEEDREKREAQDVDARARRAN